MEFVLTPVGDALEPYREDELDLISVRYTPRVADLMPETVEDGVLGGAAWTYYMTFDHTGPVGENRDLRLALAHVIDRDALAEILPANLVIATGGLVPPTLQGHTPDIAPRFDPDLARDLLRRSGWTEGLSALDTDERAVIVEALARIWEEVLGLPVRARIMPLAEMLAVPRLWDIAPLVVSGWLPGYPDPEYYLRLLLHSESKTNEGGFADPAFDDLVERARQERDGRARQELFHRADRLVVAEEAAVLPLAYGRSMAFVKPWVQGWWEFGKSCSSLADLVVREASPRAR